MIRFQFTILLYLLHCTVIFCVNAYSSQAEVRLDLSTAKPMNEISHIINSRYIDSDTVSEQKLLDGALSGTVQALDPYSDYLNADDLREFENNTDGHFGGIGIEMTQDKKAGQFVTIMTVLNNTPASRSGVHVGDLLMAIDDLNVTNMTLYQVSKHARGKIGTKIKINIFRPSENKYHEFTMLREEIKINSVYLKYHKQIPTIEIRMFGTATYKDFVNILGVINRHNVKGLIIDLRNNPGGLLESAVKICDIFLKTDSRITTVIGRKDIILHEYIASKKNEMWLHRTPIYVLINKGSASASEILAACLKENNIAILAGEQSFGKASVQEIIDLKSNPGSALKLTIAKYLTPKGNMIHGIGVKPDIAIQDSRKDGSDKILDIIVNQILALGNSDSKLTY